MKIINLLTDNKKNPIGYKMDKVHLSWNVEDAKGKNAKSIRVVIYSDIDTNDIIHDSGKMDGNGITSYLWGGELKPQTRYYWNVIVEDSYETVTSETAFFETGKLNSKWVGDWIGTEENPDRMPNIYKDISISKKVAKARIYVYACGLFEAYINKQKVGEEVLSPGYHSYDMNNQYHTYDITDHLSEGNNRIEVLLGEGWYKGRFCFDGDYRNIYGEYKKFIGEIHIQYEDNTNEIIATDESWKAKESHILSNGIYDGEIIDETAPIKELKVCAYKDSKELLTERFNSPIVKEELATNMKIIQETDDFILYDAGKIITGWVEVKASFDNNQTIEMLHGEVLQNGEFYNDNLRTAKAEFVYTSSGKLETIRPHFTFYGFRYVKVSGISSKQIEAITAYTIMTDMCETGSIITSNDKVNQLFENTKQSQRCNFLDIPTDCPQRDERMGWTGDISVFASTACFHMDSQNIFDHYLKNLADEQKLLGGSVPFFVPNPKLEMHENINPFYISSGASVWGDVATILPWTLYEYYGRKDKLQEYFSVMTDWVDFITKRTSENQTKYLWQNDRQLGDWLALDNGNIHNPIGKTDTGFLASAFYYHSVQLCEKAADILKDSRHQEYYDLKNNIKSAFIREFFTNEGKLKIEPTQTACAVLLSFELYDECNKNYITAELHRLLSENGMYLNTGFVGTFLLLPALSANEMNETAYTLLLNEQYPSWLYEVNLGATTVWERWNSLLEDGTISGTEMNSLNHYAYGCISNWMYRYMCGFQPQMHKDIKMVIKPMPDKRIGYVKGSWQSIYGEYEVAWEYSGDNVYFKIVVPWNANAEVVFENNLKKTIESGTYYFDENGNEVDREIMVST